MHRRTDLHRRRLAGAGAAVIVLLASGCGGSGRSAAPTTVRPVPRPPATTTTLPPPPQPAALAATACRAFVSFFSLVGSTGQDGPDAYGEVGGMVVEAKEAVTASHGAARWKVLEERFTALEAYTASKAWSPTPKAERTAPMLAVAQLCRADT
jgi:hypothetical protein